MSTILVGVDAGSYAFDASTKAITISGIPGLTLQSIKLVVDQTNGKTLYAFDGALPATLTSGVLHLNAATDVSGCSNGDALAIYAQAGLEFGDPQGGEVPAINYAHADFDEYTLQSGTLTTYASNGPFPTTSAHHWVSPVTGGNGLSWFYPLDGRTDGMPITFAFYAKGTGRINLNLKNVLNGVYYDLAIKDYKLTPEWRRVHVTMIPVNRRIDDLSFQLITAEDGTDCYLACPTLHFGLIRPGRWSNIFNKVPGYANAYGVLPPVLPVIPNQPPSIEWWGDSMPGAAQNQQELKRAMGGGLLSLHSFGGQTSSYILTQFNARTDLRAYGLSLFWCGRNYPDATQVPADIAAMIGGLPHGQFLVLSTCHTVAEFGAGSYAIVESINTKLKAAYGSRFVDLNAVLCDPTTGMHPEFSADGVHNNVVGSTLVADAIRAAYKANGWA